MKRPLKNNEYLYSEGKGYSISVETMGGYYFVHLDVEAFSPSGLRSMREEVVRLKNEMKEKGVLALFATAQSEQSEKLIKSVRKPDHEQELIDEYGNKAAMLFTWETEED